MNVWILNHYAITPDQPGGTRHYDLGRELVRRGHAVTIFASSYHHYQRRFLRQTNRDGWAIEEFDGVRFVWLRTVAYGGNDWRRAWSMVDYWIRVRRWARRLSRSDGPLVPPDIVLDLSAVHFVGSSQLAQMLRLRKTVVDHGTRLRVVGSSESVRNVFHTTGLDKVFEFMDDVTTALAQLQIDK